jgi:hypothetical protein
LRREPHELQKKERDSQQRKRRVDQGDGCCASYLDEEERSGDQEIPDRQASA